MPVSSWMTSWVLRAMRAEKSVGRPSASSKELVCRLCVPPSTAAIASIVVRTTLLYGSCSVSDTPLVWQCVRSISDCGFFGSKVAMTRSHRRRAARSLATSMKKFMPMAKKNDSRGANSSMSRPAVGGEAHVLQPVGDGEGELEVGRRAGLLHVVAGDRDRVEPRHVLGGVADDVGHDPHARLGRVDVGVADHELLEDVVLDGPAELVLAHALLLAGHDEAGQHREHGAVHRHRHRHLLEGDAVEEDLHVLDGVDGHARPCRRRRPRAGGRSRSRGGWRGRRRPTRPAGRRPGCAGRRRSTPRRWRTRRTGGSSTAGRRTSWPARPARTGGSPGSVSTWSTPSRSAAV